MTLTIKPQRKACALIAVATIALLPATVFAKPKPITPVDLLETLLPGEPWDRSVLTAPKAVIFQQADASSGTNATHISKVTLSYFKTTNCTGSGQGIITDSLPIPSYTTPDGTSFPISVGTPFGLVAASAWNVGRFKLNIGQMTNIHSIAVTFKSTNNNTPQANFSGVGFACLHVICTKTEQQLGQCTLESGSVESRSFQLKTAAAIGDPADGGIIACLGEGLANLVASASDNSEGIVWSPEASTKAFADSTTDGASNTLKIVKVVGPTSTYAAGVCEQYSAAGGYISGWFLPAGNNTTNSGQLNCLYTNRAAIGGFKAEVYWSSTENSPDRAYAW